MKISNILAALAAASVAICPVGAQAALRKPAPAHSAQTIAENPWIPILVMLGVALAIILVVTDDNSKSP